MVLAASLFFALKQIQIGVKQIDLLKQDMLDRSQRAAAEKGIEFLRYYATVIIPGFDEYVKKLQKDLPDPQDTSHLFDGNFNHPYERLDKRLGVEVIIKQFSGLVRLFNELEYFAAAILARLADEDLVFTPVGKNFCDWVKKEHLVLAIMRNRGTPYKNVVELYKKWSDRLEVETYQLQMQEAEHKIMAKGTGYLSRPPLGLERER